MGHPQAGPGALAGQALGGARQQGMGGLRGTHQPALRAHPPALLQRLAGPQHQFRAAAKGLQQHLAGSVVMALGIGEEMALQHLLNPATVLQPPHRILGAGLEGPLAGPEHQGQQQDSRDQSAPGAGLNASRTRNVGLGWAGFHGPSSSLGEGFPGADGR
ncbi:MAG: hypothetical protein ACKOOH_04845 [Cyanobium sp.]